MQKILSGRMRNAIECPASFTSFSFKSSEKSCSSATRPPLVCWQSRCEREPTRGAFPHGSAMPWLGAHVYGSASMPGLRQAARAPSPENAGRASCGCPLHPAAGWKQSPIFVLLEQFRILDCNHSAVDPSHGTKARQKWRDLWKRANIPNALQELLGNTVSRCRVKEIKETLADFRTPPKT